VRGPAEASVRNQRKYLEAFVQRAAQENIDYLINEAFDQPWKAQQEGIVGKHWGLFNADRTKKNSRLLRKLKISQKT
jgi:exo-beta-1,3-glucanase (GH17 family)